MTRGLVRCGFALDPNDVVASNKLWRLPAARWVEVFRECLETPDRSHLIRANVAFDFRQIAGSLEIAPPLVAVLREAKDHPDLLRRLARMATDFKPPLGFRGSLANGKGLDLKQGGMHPDREPRPLLRALERDHDLEHDRPPARRFRRRAPSTRRPRRRCARRSRS